MKLSNKWLFLAAALTSPLFVGGAAAQSGDGAEVVRESQASVANEIRQVQVTRQAGTLYVQITLKEPLAAVPASFTVASPARIAFDFPATGNASGMSVFRFNEGELVGANVVQVGDRTRVVFNLTQLVQYDAKVDGNTLLVALTSAAAHAASGSQAVFAPALKADAREGVGLNSILDVNFRRGNDGEGRVVVDLTDPNTPIDIRKKGDGLVVDFKGVFLPEHLRRKSDVTDFATPVTQVVSRAVADGMVLEVTPNGLWEHNAYQTDKQFVLELKRLQEDPNKLVQGGRGKYSGEKLSLNFQNIDVRSILQVLADFTGFNIVTSDSVKGSLTLRLKDVPWDQALDIILDAKGLDKRKQDNVIWIAPVDELRKREQELAKLKMATVEREPLVTERFVINYHDAKAIATLLTGQQKSVQKAAAAAAKVIGGTPAEAQADDVDSGGPGILTVRGTVTAEQRTNAIYVTDVPSNMDNIARIISEMDIPPKQVMIEARIVEASDSFNRDIGVRLGFGSVFSGKSVGKDSAGNPIPQYSIGGGMTGTTPAVSAPRSWAVDLPAASNNNLSMVLWNNAATRFIDLELSAMETDGRIKVVSKPRVLTANRLKATIEQGEERAYSTVSQNGTNVEFKEAVLRLDVTPTITPDGKIRMAVDLKKDQFGERATDGSYPINKRSVKSEVLVDNGGTIVMGGILDERQDDKVEKVPLLGDIPVLGNLFKHSSLSTARTELMLFITPRIVDERVTVR